MMNRVLLFLYMILSVFFLVTADSYASETSVVILSDASDQEGQPGPDAENGLIADYYQFDQAAKAFTEYVSSEYVRTPVYSEGTDSRKIHALRTVGFLNARGVAFRGKIRFPEAGLYVLSVQASQGVRVKIDDVTVIDEWENTRLNTIAGKTMLIGQESVHDVSIEYYYTSGDEQFSLYWENDNSIEKELIPASFFYPPVPQDTLIEMITAEADGKEILLQGRSLENIAGITVIPFSLSSVKEPAVCKITKKEQGQILAELPSKLTPGTYRLEYIVQDRTFRTKASFFVNAGENTLAEAAGSIRRNEHPRPDRYRDDWINLNGAWRFDFDPGRTGVEEEWYRKKDYTRMINVPFSWQSDESWIGDDSYLGAAWYERDFTVDKAWLQDGKHCFLCFGAVNAQAAVYVNGEMAGSHAGGFTPFELDITSLVREGENRLTVEVIDDSRYNNNTYPAMLGKQGYDAPCGYAPTSGIWQPVFLESRGEAYVESLQVYTDVASDITGRNDGRQEAGKETESDYSTADCSVRFEAQIYSDREMDAVIRYSFSSTLWDLADEKEISTGSDFAWSMNIHLQEGMNLMISPDIAVLEAKLWSDIEPNLYVGSVDIIETEGTDMALDIEKSMTGTSGPVHYPIDHLETYFGFRRIGTGSFEGRDYEYIYVNGRPVFLSGVLDQGYWAGSGYTAPTQEDLRGDVAFLKDNGFNTMRKHLKIEDPLQYFWCDRLGIYVMQDMPYASALNAQEEGGAVQGRQLYEKTLEELLQFSTGHPSIISIQLFNEGWGVHEPGLMADDGMTTLEWQQHLYDLAKSLNSGILVEDMSPYKGDHIQPTDINSFHSYPTSYTAAKAAFDAMDAKILPGGAANFRQGFFQEGEPWIVSEYGGVGVFSGDLDISFSLKYQTDLLRQHEKLAGVIYTQAADVEYERNGLRTFDRKEKKFGYNEIAYGMDMTIQDLMQPAYIGIAAEPVTRSLPGSEFSADVVGMNWSEHDYGEVTLHWVLEGTDTRGDRFRASDAVQSRPVSSDEKSGEVFLSGETAFSYPRCTKSTKKINFALPDTEGIAVLTVWIEKDEVTIAKNFIYVILCDEKLDPTFEAAEDACILRGDLDEKYIEGSGTVVIHFTGSYYELLNYLREQGNKIGPESPVTMNLVMELSSVKGFRSTGGIRHAGTSQTTIGDEQPSTVIVSANGIYLDTIVLYDECRDMRGILTLQNGIYGNTSAGSFGELISITADSETTAMILDSAEERGSLDVTLTVPASTEYSNGVRVYDDMDGRYMVRPAIVLGKP